MPRLKRVSPTTGIAPVDLLVLAEPELRPHRRRHLLAGLLGRQLDRTEVGDQLVDLLGRQRPATLGAPGGHRRARAAVDEDLPHLLLAEPEQHRVQRRGPPGDRGDELAVGVGERERGRLAADALGPVAAGAVVPTVARGCEEPGASVDEGLIEVLDGAALPPGFVEPVEREADRRDRHQDEPGAEGTGEPWALERLVVVVGLAVGRQLDLGGDLGSTGADVDDDVGDEADPGDHRDHHADCLHRAGRQHGREEKDQLSDPPRCRRSAGLRLPGRWCWCRWAGR